MNEAYKLYKKALKEAFMEGYLTGFDTAADFDGLYDPEEAFKTAECNLPENMDED